MPQIKKIATRQSYGEVLAELGEENKNIVVLDADLSGSTKSPAPPRHRSLPKNSLTDSSTAVSRKETWRQ